MEDDPLVPLLAAALPVPGLVQLVADRVDAFLAEGVHLEHLPDDDGLLLVDDEAFLRVEPVAVGHDAADPVAALGLFLRADLIALEEKARALVGEAREENLKALDPYREACCKAGVACEYEGGRSANVSEKVSFLVEKTDKGVRVMVKGQPKTEEVIPLAVLKESINKAAYAYTDKHVGPREEVGNKGGSLSNRLRAVLNA